MTRIFQVHECVLGFYSNYFRFLIRRAKEENPGKLVLEFKNYSKEIMHVSVNNTKSLILNYDFCRNHFLFQVKIETISASDQNHNNSFSKNDLRKILRTIF